MSESNTDAPTPPPITPAPFWKMFQYARGNDYFLIFVGVICSLIQGAMYPLIFYEVTEIVDSMDDSRDENGSFDEDEYYDKTVDVVYIMIAAGFIALISAYIAALCLSFVAIRQANAFRQAYFNKLLSKQQEWFDKRNVHEVPIQLTQDTQKIEKATGDKLILFINTISSIGTGLILAFLASAQLTLLGLLQFPLVMGGMIIVGYATVRTVTMMQQAYTEAGGIANECIEDVKAVSANNMQEYTADKYDKALAPTEQVQKTMGALTGIGWGLVMMAWLTSSALLFWQGSVMMDHNAKNWFGGNELETADVLLCIFVVGFSCQAVGFLVPGIQGIVEGQVACQRIMNSMAENDHPSIISTTPQVKPEIEGSIEFRNVTFKYPTQPYHTILNNMSFRIEKNERVAFVGETGCGKSTIINLIERIYDDYEGEILVDGVDLQTIDKAHFRSKVGLVSQEPILFNTSIYENIRYGDLDANQDEIYYAAEQANAHDFIMSLPDRYDTIVGSKGGKLSGGQKQRIAIARAILRNPRIMLLDEATSSLDKPNELQIMQTLWQFSTNRTTIMVAQRLSTIRNADRIIVLSQGRIAESGSHEQLVESQGQYYTLLSRQEEQQETYSVSTKSKTLSETDEDEALETEDTQFVVTSDSVKTLSAEKDFNIYMRVLRMSKDESYLIFCAVLSAAIGGAVLPLFGFLMAEQMDSMLSETNDETMKRRCARYSLWMLVLSFVILIAFAITGFFQSLAGASLTTKIRKKSFRALLYHDMAYFDQQNKARLASTLASDTEKVHKLIGPLFVLIVMICSAIMVGLIIGFNNNWQVSLVVVSLIPFFAYGLIRRHSLNLSGFSNRSYDDNIANDSLQNLKTVRAYGLEEYLEDVYIKQHQELQEETEVDLHVNAFTYGISLLLMYLVFATCFWFAAWEVDNNDAEREETNVSLFSGLMCGFAINVASTFAPDVDEARKAAKRLFDIIDYRSTIDCKTEPPQSAPKITGEFQFDDVCFKYPSREVAVLNNVSFYVEPGKFFSITGQSGSGKSTVMQLMIRLYDPGSGTITLDGQDLRQFNVKSLRSQVVYVAQDSILFNGSIRDNLTLGQPIKDEEIWDAVKKATAFNFVDKYGLDRYVGTSGSLLSGGQKQRLAIARALLRKPTVLLLDESTSALDSTHENAVLASLRGLTPAITVINIAHRISSINLSDIIAVMEGGYIVEIGEPSELMKREGHYYKIVTSSS